MLFDHFFLSDSSLKTPYITRYVRRFCLKSIKNKNTQKGNLLNLQCTKLMDHFKIHCIYYGRKFQS